MSRHLIHARSRKLLGECFELVKLSTSGILRLAVFLVAGVVVEHRVPRHVLCSAECRMVFTVNFGNGELIFHMTSELCPTWCKLLAMSAPA